MTIDKINIDNCFNVTNSPRLFERFKTTDGPVYDSTIFEQITYQCYNCSCQITFKDKDFQKHSNSNFTNLSKIENELLNSFVQTNKLEQKSYLDFYCPTCKIPTRIYFSDGWGGKHGEYLVSINFGLTIKNNEL